MGLKSDSHFMFGQIALAGFLAEYSTCTEIWMVESNTGTLAVREWQLQSETGNLNKTRASGALGSLAEE